MSVGGVTVSGPGLDRRAPSPAVGLSVAITHANRASMRREEASFYVRDRDGAVIGRADADGQGGVQVLGAAALQIPAAAGRRGDLLPSRPPSAARRNRGRAEVRA